jgi:hypothetical protein
MSFDYNKWESELRSKVETHEFAFDESAWEEMDKLLDQAAGTLAPKDNLPPTSSGRFTNWIMGGLIVTFIGLLSWWMINTSNEKTIPLSGFSISISEEEATTENQVTFENAPAINKAGSTTTPKNNNVLPAQVPQNPITTSVTTTARTATELVDTQVEATPEESTTALPDLPVEETPPPMLPPADRSAAYLTPLLERSKDIALLPTALDDPLPETSSVSIKRRRDRRTLYPDVIERY